ncbi:hypothetical protein D3C85_1727760 [compost metagenome]
MQISGIHDFCVFVQVMRLALLSRKHTGLGRKTHPMLYALKDYRFDFIEGEVTDNEYLCVPKFQVTRRTVGVNHAS